MTSPNFDAFVLAESVSLVAGYEAVTGLRLRKNKTSSGEPRRTEAAALLIELADDGCITVENGATPRVANRPDKSRTRLGLNEPSHPLLLPPWQALHKRGKPKRTEDFINETPTGKIHERLTAAGLATRGGNVITRDCLTPQGIHVRAQLSAELDTYLDPEREADPEALSERTALTLALMLYGSLHDPLHQGQGPEASLETKRRMNLASKSLNTQPEKIANRTHILAALFSANARDDWV